MAIIYVGEEYNTFGTGEADTIYGTEKYYDNIFGKGGNDTLWGYGGGDYLSGGSGNDKLYGGTGNDELWGDSGRDTLTGGSGKDEFGFGTKPSRTTVDVITDFNSRDDRIMLAKGAFKDAGEADSQLKSSAFWKGTKAHDADDRIIYNNKTGALYYDPDGTGLKAAVQFAKLKPGLSLTYKDFYIDII